MMGEKNDFFNVQDIMNGVMAFERMADSTIAAGAKVVCTACAENNSNAKMVKGSSCLLLQKSIELGHKDIEFQPLFSKCLVGDHVCKPEIEGKAWQSYDETKVTSTGDHSLLKDKSYMLCTKGFGIIYATDNGQKIDQRQSESLAILFQRWHNNPSELGYLKGISLCQAYSADPVNLNTGNFIYEYEDLSIAGVMPLNFKRFYNALDTRTGCLGEGWIHNFEIHLMKKKNILMLFLEDGKEIQFKKVSEELYIDRHTGLETIKLLRNGHQITYVYTTSDQHSHIFDQEGKEIRREDAHGNRMLLMYNSQGFLEEVDGSGIKFFFDYDKTGKLVMLSDHTGRKVQFIYKENSLYKVTDTDKNSVTYQYDENKKIQEIINPRKIRSLRNEYDYWLRTVKQIFPDDGEVQYRYHDEEMMVEMEEQNGNRVKHYYDQQYRNIKTVHEDGKEEFTYNEQNKKIRYKDKRGYLTQYEYDKQGNQIKIVDALKNQISKRYNDQNKLLTLSVNGITKIKNEYDPKGKLLKSEDAIKRTSEFRYNCQGLPVEIVRPDGSQYHFTYDPKGSLIKITDSQNFETHYQYDHLNRIRMTTDANGNTLSYQYDSRDNLVKVVNAAGKEQRYTYNESNRVTSFTDYDGSITYQEYGVLRKPNKMINAMGSETILEYDLMWNLCQVTDANGGVTKYTYNHANLLTSVITPLGGTTTIAYDPNGNRTRTTDSNGAVTEFTYDALNRIIQVKEPNDGIHCYEYNAEGQVLTYTNPLNQVVRYEYDYAGQKTKEINALGQETIFTYNSLAKLIQVRKAGSTLARYQYDSRGLLTDEFHLDGRTAHYSYDGNQNLIKKSDQKGCVLEYEYDSADRVTQIRSNYGQVNQYKYDAVGNLTIMIDTNGNKTEYIYDPCQNLIGVVDAQGNQTAYGYDWTGKLTHIIQGEYQFFTKECRVFDLTEVLKINEQNQLLRVTTYQRNLAGQLEQVIDPLGNTEKYTYNAAGKLTSKSDQDGYLTSYTYDVAGSLNKIEYDDGREVKLSYNPLRQLVQVEDWLGITKIDHDELARPIKIIDHKERAVSYTYGQLGERKSIKYPDGKSVAYQYDEHLRLSEVSDSTVRVSYAYDCAGQLKEKNFLNGMKTTYSYHQSGQLANLTHWNHQGKSDEYQYTYDDNGNKIRIQKQRIGLNSESGTYQYDYDSLNRLNKVSKDGYLLRSYDYDHYGNRIGLTEEKRSTNYTYNAANQLINKTDVYLVENQPNIIAQQENYRYDKRGNLIAVERNERPINQYYFGALNRLEKAVDHVTGTGAVYTYNGLGHRSERIEGSLLEPLLPAVNLREMKLNPMKQVDDVIDLTKQYHNLLQRNENHDTTSFLWGENVVSSSKEDGTIQLYFQDDLGSPVRIREVGTREHKVYGYDEFGNDLPSNLASVQPFGYTGYQYDAVAGTYYAQAREYMAKAGRFTGTDLIKGNQVYPAGLNSYVYCLNQPMDLVDLNGLWPSWNDITNGIITAGNTITDGVMIVTNTITDGVIAVGDAVVNGANQVIGFVKDVAEDISNFDMQNSDEQKVLNSEYISAYKGQLVIRWAPGNRSGSLGPVMFLQRDNADAELIKHEWGHYTQYQQMGTLQYLLGIGLPSAMNGGAANYYAQPWEITADMNGGVSSRTHTQADMDLGVKYLEYLKSIKSPGDWFEFLKALPDIKNHDMSILDGFCP